MLLLVLSMVRSLADMHPSLLQLLFGKVCTDVTVTCLQIGMAAWYALHDELSALGAPLLDCGSVGQQNQQLTCKTQP